jgi:hypothetical protein
MKTILALITLLTALNVNAQKTSAKHLLKARQEAEEINYLLGLLESISPFNDSSEIAFGFPDYEKFSPSANAWEIIDSCNFGIAERMKTFIENENYYGFRCDTMLNLAKTYSPDSNLIVYNWYTNNGGTFLMCTNLMQVNLLNGKKEIFEMDYAGNLYESGNVPLANENGYYFIGSTKGCSSCFDYTVMLFTLDENGLLPLNVLENTDSELEYSFGIYFRGWDFDNNYISYNDIDHSFEYAHKNDDADSDEIFYEEGKWTFNGRLFQQEVTLQLEREEFENLFGESDNN